jgi:mannosyltransferase OCH1-like enzyme
MNSVLPIPTIPTIPTIPLILHQIWWQGRDKVPKDYPNHSQSWINLNPTFKYMFWDERNITQLVKEFPSHIQQAFNGLPHMIQKIDMAKFLILHKHGGLYVDMDSECLKPVQELLTSSQVVLVQINVNMLAKFLGYGRLTGDMLQNGIMAGTRQHPFWMYCIKCLMEEDKTQRVLETRLKYIFRTTGPGLLTRAYNSAKLNGQAAGIKMLPHELVDSVSYCDYEVYKCATQNCAKRFPNAYSIHHFGSKSKRSSWLSDNERWISVLYCRYQNWIQPLLWVVAVVVAFYLSKRLIGKTKR